VNAKVGTPLERVIGEAVAGGVDTASPADGEEARVLARAVVLDRRRRGSRLELVLRRGSRREERAHDLELLGERHV